VFGKSLIEQKSFKFRFKNSQRITDENCLLGNWKARLEKSVLVNGLSSSGMAAERKVPLLARVAIRRCIDKPEWTCSELCTSELPTCMT